MNINEMQMIVYSFFFLVLPLQSGQMETNAQGKLKPSTAEWATKSWTLIGSFEQEDGGGGGGVAALGGGGQLQVKESGRKLTDDDDEEPSIDLEEDEDPSTDEDSFRDSR